MVASSPGASGFVAANAITPASSSALHATLSSSPAGGHICAFLFSRGAEASSEASSEASARNDASGAYSSPAWFSKSASGSNARKYPSPFSPATPYVRECTTETAAANAS